MDIKEIANVWYEFLKLNDEYKKLCDLERESSPVPMPLFAYMESDGYKLDESRTCYVVSLDLERGILPGCMADTWKVFGNVQKNPFDDFWAEKKDRFEYCGMTQAIMKGDSKSATRREIGDDLRSLLKLYKTSPKFDGSAESFIDMVDGFYKTTPHWIHVQVDMASPIKKINEDFKGIVNNDKRREYKSYGDREAYRICRNRMPTPNFKPELLSCEFKRYLDTLRAFKIDNLKGRAAFEKVRPKGDYGNPDERSVFHKDKGKAERIATNVGLGFFPGPYEKNFKK